MLIGKVHPTTLDGVKSLAWQLRKERGIKYSAALDIAAQAANCTNFRNALRTLPPRGASVVRPYVLLSMYWSDRDQRNRRGRETLRIELTKPILNICDKSSLKRVRGFGNLRMVAADHFVCDELAHTQEFARECLCTAERSLRFMEHTGLLPFRGRSAAYDDGLANDKLPDIDHPTYWVDPANGQFILIDEPYGDRPDEVKRTAWSDRTGWRIAKTSWPGMYNPYSCDLYAVTEGGSGYNLDALLVKINAMPAPLLEENWPGESCPSWETFVSPMAKTPQDVRRARCRGTVYPAASATTVPYSYSPGSSRRRPVGEMGIDGHIEAGRIIKAVMGSEQAPYGAYRRMAALRSTLEDWMGLEIDDERFEDSEFFEVYYRKAPGDVPYRKVAETRDGMVDLLGNLKRLLQAAYPDCAPLRRQLHRIDMSLLLIGKTRLAGK